MRGSAYRHEGIEWRHTPTPGRGMHHATTAHGGERSPSAAKASVWAYRGSPGENPGICGILIRDPELTTEILFNIY
jgi:hypothetical protein